MPGMIDLRLSEDELEIVLDALDADREGYLEAAKEARGNGKRADVETFTEAAARIEAVAQKLQKLLG